MGLEKGFDGMARVEYTLSMKFPHSHYFDAQIIVKDVLRETQHFVMPVWTPGSYLVREFERNVSEFFAYGDGGKNILPSTKVSKNTWRVETKGSKAVTARYRVYAYEYTVDTSYLDADHAIINPASVLMYPEGYENEEMVLRLVPPTSWKKASTALERYGGGKGKFAFFAPNYDILVDSPIEVGNHETYFFDVNGKRHEVALFGAAGATTIDKKRFVSDLKKIVQASAPVYGELPYDKYVFIIDLTGGQPGGGLEHLNSTHCITSRFVFEPKQVYNRMLGLFSHEFFHLWNVKRMRPVNLGPFDYTKENYTRSLWVAEGITSYYDDLILRRGGIYTVPEYLDALVEQFNRFLATPGRKVQSAEESSFDTWVKFYRPNENSVNMGISYYVKGAILGWMLDMEIRRANDSKRTLDDVMRRVYIETYKQRDRGYTEQEFQEACESVAGKSLRDIFENHVRGTSEIDFNYYLDFAGLKLEPKSKDSNKKKDEEKKGFLGLKLKTEGGRVLVDTVLSDTPASLDGIYVGDEIIAADGTRVDEKTLSFYIETRKPNTQVLLTLSRDSRIRETKVKLSEKPTFVYRIQKREKATSEQKRLFKKWLGEEWDVELKYEEWPASPLTDRLLFTPNFV
jgi:predicted metalloprotease with PDZ domain